MTLAPATHYSVSQGRIRLDRFTYCHTVTQAADQTFDRTHSQYTDDDNDNNDNNNYNNNNNDNNEESLKIGLKIHKGKTKFMTSIDTTDNIQINGTEIEKVTNYKYLGQTIAMENSTKQEVSIRIKAGWTVFGKYREIFLGRYFPMSLNRKVFNQCVLPAMTWMTNMVSHKSISKETRNKSTSYGRENAECQAERQNS